MVSAYLIIGKRFTVWNVEHLNSELKRYNLISNQNQDGTGSLTVREIGQNQGVHYYSICPLGEYTEGCGDVVVGSYVGYKNNSDMVVTKISDLEMLLAPLRQRFLDDIFHGVRIFAGVRKE